MTSPHVPSELGDDPFADPTAVNSPVWDSLTTLLAAAVTHDDALPEPVKAALAAHTRTVMAQLGTPEVFHPGLVHMRNAVALLTAYGIGESEGDATFGHLANLAHQMIAEDPAPDLNATVAALCAVSFALSGVATDDYMESLRRFGESIDQR